MQQDLKDRVGQEREGLCRIGLHVNSSHGYGRSILRGITRFAQTRPHWQLILLDLTTPGNEIYLEEPYRLDGLICELRPASVLRLSEAIPAVVAVASGLTVPGNRPGFSAVSTDNVVLGQLAWDYFEESRFENFAFVASDAGTYSPARLEGFQQAAMRAGRSVHLFAGEAKPASRHKTNSEDFRSWIRALPRPCAVFAANDALGTSFVREATLHGYAIPDDFAVLGVDNDRLLCEMSSPPLSSIDLGSERIGYEGAGALDEHLTGQSATSQVRRIEPVGIVERRSTQTIVTRNPNLQRAMQLVLQEACDGLTANDVCDRVPMSRRALEVQFRATFHTSIRRKIEEVRLRRAKDLLVGTTQATADIAAACGWSSASQFSIVFRRTEGVTPSAYRKAAEASWSSEAGG